MRRRSRLDQTRAWLARWRAQHGGRGIPVPEALWAEAVEVARVEGIEETARRLRLDRSRLAGRMQATGAAASGEPAGEVGAGSGFVELDAGRLGLSPRTVIRLAGRDGERLEVELGAGAAIDLAALADTFWRRGR
jgi:hypothetical protein